MHLRVDLNGAPNIWGEPPNRAYKTLAACEPGELLAAAEFIGHLKSQTTEFDSLIGPRRLRAAKRGRLLRIHRIITTASDHPPQSNEPVDVVDFEAPYREMVSQYKNLAKEVADSTSGIWTLLLSRRLKDLGQISQAEYDRAISGVSLQGRLSRARSPYHELFSQFSRQALSVAIDAGEFRNLDAGEVLCEEGQPANSLYVLAEGRAEVVTEGRVVVVRGPGDLVGEMALIEPVTQKVRTEGMVRNATVVAVDPVTVFSIPYDAIIRSTDDVNKALVRYYQGGQKSVYSRGIRYD